jgi:transposase
MKFQVFIGIDVSKSHIDVFIRKPRIHAKFSNNETGFQKMITWIEQHIDYAFEKVMFAFEHTGLYSLPLSLFLNEHQYSFTLIPGLELKKSMGISRGKNDRDDAKRIAEYAYEKKEKVKLYQMPSDTLLKMKRLLSYRERLVKERAAFKGRLKEYGTFLNQEENSVLFESHVKMIAHLSEEIKQVEKELYKLIKADEKLAQQFYLINSIKGVGPQTALVMIVLTNGFTSFERWRKFASYAGTAPFVNESGTFKGSTKISHLANKRIKTLLSCCAISAVQFNPEIKMYYQRRLAEGKNQMSTLNIVRNKLLARIFAVVQRGTPYVDTYKFAA